MCACEHISTYVCICACADACTCTCVCAWKCAYECACVCSYAHTWTCACACLHICSLYSVGLSDFQQTKRHYYITCTCGGADRTCNTEEATSSACKHLKAPYACFPSIFLIRGENSVSVRPGLTAFCKYRKDNIY